MPTIDLNPTVATLTASFTFDATEGIVISGVLPQLVAEWVVSDGITFDVVLPKLLAAISITQETTIEIDGAIVLSASASIVTENIIAIDALVATLTADFVGVKENIIAINGVLPTIIADFRGDIENDLSFSIIIPPLMAALVIDDVTTYSQYVLRYEHE